MPSKYLSSAAYCPKRCRPHGFCRESHDLSLPNTDTSQRCPLVTYSAQTSRSARQSTDHMAGSHLVTHHLSPLPRASNIVDFSFARHARARRAHRRASNLCSPPSSAIAADCLPCSPSGTSGPNKISVDPGSADQARTLVCNRHTSEHPCSPWPPGLPERPRERKIFIPGPEAFIPRNPGAILRLPFRCKGTARAKSLTALHLDSSSPASEILPLRFACGTLILT